MGLAFLTLLGILEDTDIMQKWYANNGNSVGALESIHLLRREPQEHCQAFGNNITESHELRRVYTRKGKAGKGRLA